MNRTEAIEVEQPFSNWPKTVYLEGEEAFHITGRYIAPSWWWQKGFPAILMLLALILAPASCSIVADRYFGGNLENMTAAAFWTTTIAWFGAFLAVVIVAEHFGSRRELDVKLSRDTIDIKGRRYARAAQPQFALEDHEKAFAEESEERREGKNHSRIYRDAMQVVMRYGERRITIADFRRVDVRMAEALLVRLQLLHKDLDEMLGIAETNEAPATPGARDDFGAPPPIR